jgi:hypothetical protein
MSGLLAARALSDHFERITVVERDVLPESAEVRKGVPQSAHAHGLLASGYRAMDEYFPGMMDELEARGHPGAMSSATFYGSSTVAGSCAMMRGSAASR